MKTKQELFDAVYRHLMTQKAKSEGLHLCLYRGPNGLKCAVGALIADEHFREDFNTLAATDMKVKAALRASGVDPDALDLYTLQRVHDVHPVEEWPAELAKFAARFDLVVPEVSP